MVGKGGRVMDGEKKGELCVKRGVVGGKRGMVKGGQKGEGYEWETWGWLWLGKCGDG